MWHGRLDGRISSRPQLSREGVLRVGFAMYQVDVRHCGACAPIAHGVEPLLELVTVSVRAVTCQHLDSRTECDFFPKDAQHWRLLDDPAPERVLGLEADDEHGVSWIGCTVRQMVQDAPCLGHS